MKANLAKNFIALQIFSVLQGLDQNPENFFAVDAFLQRLLGWLKDTINFGTHGLANLITLFVPSFVVEQTEERVCCTGAEVLLLTELHELYAGSSLRIACGQILPFGGRSRYFESLVHKKLQQTNLRCQTYPSFYQLDVIALTVDRDS
jgi:hypothetical protein